MALDYFDGMNQERWMRNGAAETLESLDRHEGFREVFINFMKNLPYTFEDEHYLYVHAGLRPGTGLENQTPWDLVWIREDFFMSQERFPKPVIFGHTPVRTITGETKPIVLHGNIAIDTACVYGGFLTMLVIQQDGTWEYVQSDRCGIEKELD